MKWSLAIAFLFACAPALASDVDDCPRISKWSHIPQLVRSALSSKVGRIAEEGQRYNATDVVSSDLANNRFLIGCQAGPLVSVALERGGSRAFRIEVFQFKSGQFIRSWTQRLDINGSVTVELTEPPVAR